MIKTQRKSLAPCYFAIAVISMLGACLLPRPAAADPTDLTAAVTLGAKTASTDGTPDTIRATFTVTNPTSSPIKFAVGGLSVVWLILDAQDSTVYDSRTGKMAPHILILRILPAGGHMDFPATVPLRDQSGNPLAPGTYTLRGQLWARPSLTASTQFTVPSSPAH